MPKSNRELPFETVALLLQGGGALGAFQAGVYQALFEAGVQPNWVAGISIGGINAAIIAGNAPEKRIEKLRKFWELITTTSIWDQQCSTKSPFLSNDTMRTAINQMSANSALMNGVPNFFTPRVPTPWLHKRGSLDATSYYDTSKLRATLESLIDFDLLNNGDTRLSLGAVNVRSGNFVYFDTQTQKIGLDHILASGALPPGFPAIEIEGEYYWDGGLVSNTPLQWVVDTQTRKDTLAFQVDLWSAEGEFPRDMAEVMTRQKEILYSSRTRANTDRFKNSQKLHHAFAVLLEKLPDDLKNTPEAKLLASVADHKVYNLVHLIYRARTYEGDSKDYEFSRLSMHDHWQAGYNDTLQTLSHPEIFERPTNAEGVAVYDMCHKTPIKPQTFHKEAAE